MKPYTKIHLPLLLTMIMTGMTHASDKHVHGEAELFVAIEGEQVLIELETPADNILGFEHKPSTDAQKQLLQDRLALLQQYSNVLAFNDGNCKQIKSEVESPFEAHDDHGHHEHHKHHDDKHHNEDKHSNFHINYSLTCVNASVIASAKITAFQLFEGFKTIQVNWLTASQQGSSKTTKNKTTVYFK